MAKRTRNCRDDMPSFNFSVFVMAHLDISPRSIILDAEDRLWLTDWGLQAHILQYFEAATLMQQGQDSDFSKLVLERLSYDKLEFEKMIRICSVLHFFDPDDVSHYLIHTLFS
jgi:hypothetical protein